MFVYCLLSLHLKQVLVFGNFFGKNNQVKQRKVNDIGFLDMQFSSVCLFNTFTNDPMTKSN